MIANRQMLVIGLQCVLWTTEDHSTVVSMRHSSEEVCIVADLEGQMFLYVLKWNQGMLLQRLVVLQHVWELCILSEHALNVLAHN